MVKIFLYLIWLTTELKIVFIFCEFPHRKTSGNQYIYAMITFQTVFAFKTRPEKVGENARWEGKKGIVLKSYGGKYRSEFILLENKVLFQQFSWRLLGEFLGNS